MLLFDTENSSPLKARIQPWADAAVAPELSKALWERAAGLGHGNLGKAKIRIKSSTSGD